jgi:hypothetical protein
MPQFILGSHRNSKIMIESITIADQTCNAISMTRERCKNSSYGPLAKAYKHLAISLVPADGPHDNRLTQNVLAEENIAEKMDSLSWRLIGLPTAVMLNRSTLGEISACNLPNHATRKPKALRHSCISSPSYLYANVPTDHNNQREPGALNALQAYC